MAGTTSSRDDDFPSYLQQISDAKLEETARDYIWMAEVGPEVGRGHYIRNRDMTIAECERRGRPEIIDRARSRANGKPGG